MRIFSGIQPTGAFHLGNYIGGIRQYVAGQDRGEAIYCIVDLHSLTVDYQPLELRSRVYDGAAILVAAGLDPDRCILFRQSDVTEHTELCWLLANVTAYGELSRMTQFKDKAAMHQFVSSGLFFYPVLMAADILAYQTNEVPVGDDQRQHIELTRDIAQRFNARFGQTFTVPEGRIPQIGARVMDLQDPERKMSKTGGTEQGTIFVMDQPEVVERKIKTAVTDSGSEVLRRPDKPGITNLIEIMAVVRGVEPEAVEKEFADQGYGAFKQAVADAVVEFLSATRASYPIIRADEARLERILAGGAQKARAISSKTVDLARERMGLGPAS
jgi:tryptophanyl-tRNA synthetase